MNPVGQNIGTGGRYQVVRPLGEGGMASVFEGYDSTMRSRVAIKLLDPTFARNPRICERFRREGLIQANLKHPNVVRATDIIDDPGMLGLVMEFVEGEDLEERIGRVGPMAPIAVWEILQPVIEAVATAHNSSVVHRDLKPGNVMLEQAHGRTVPRLLDFGIAKLLSDPDGGAPKTQAGTQMGTPAYMSPEQLKGLPDVDHRTDIYALGVIAYQMLTGQRPFPEVTEYSVISRVLTGDPPLPPSQVVGNVPPELDAVIASAMAKDRAQRYQNAEQFAAAFHAVVGGGVTGPYPHVQTPTAPYVPTPAPAPAAAAAAPAVNPLVPTHASNPPRPPANPTILEEPGPVPVPSPPAKNRGPVVAGVVIAVLAVVGIAVAVGSGGDSNSAASKAPTTPTPAPTSSKPASGAAALVYPRCREDGDCRGGESCQSGRCTAPPAQNNTPTALVYPHCREDGDCRGGETCQSGRCTAPEPARPSPATPAPNTVNGAKRFYRGVISAYNNRDRSGYFDAWVYPVQCFYRTNRSWSRSEIYKKRKSQFEHGGSRQVIDRLEVLSVRPNEVHFAEESRFYKGASSSAINVKRWIAVRRVGGTWKVVAEASPRGKCFPR